LELEILEKVRLSNRCFRNEIFLLYFEKSKGFVIQMKLLHPVNSRKQPGFSEDEKAEAKLSIFKNILFSITEVHFNLLT